RTRQHASRLRPPHVQYVRTALPRSHGGADLVGRRADGEAPPRRHRVRRRIRVPDVGECPRRGQRIRHERIVSITFEPVEPSATGDTGDLRTRLANPDAFLSRTDVRSLGLERRAVDAVFRSCPVVSLPGYSRPLIRVRDYLDLMERSTFHGDRVRPC